MGQDGENTLGKVATKSGRVKNWSELFDSSVFPGTQGGPLMHIIAAKAVAFGEALQDDFKQYSGQVISNANVMANEFVKRGYKIVSGGTDNHCMLVDLRPKGITGKVAENLLGTAEITVNKNMVPFDTASPFVTSGIRVGSPAMTSRGCDEAAFERMVDMMDRVLSNPDNEDIVKEVRGEVLELCRSFPLYNALSTEKIS